MAEESVEQELVIEDKPKKRFGLLSILIYLGIVLLAVLVMFIISNMVFNMRSAKVHQVEQEIWLPSTEAKAPPLKTFAIESLQVNLSDPTNSDPSFAKVTMALAYQNMGGPADKENKAALDPINEELTKRSAEIKDKIIGLISTKSYEDLNSTDKQMILKREIINQVNSILIHGEIQDVYITDFNLVKSKY